MPDGSRQFVRLAALAASLALALGARALEICDDCEDDDRDGTVDCWDRDCLSDAACSGWPLDERSVPASCGRQLHLQRLWRTDLGAGFRNYVAGDIDADGVTEVVFADGNNWNLITVLDGATGALERTFEISDGVGRGGFSPALADVDSDGTAEVFLGRPYEDPGEAAIGRYEHDLAMTYEHYMLTSVDAVNLQQAGLGFADFEHDGQPEAYMLGTIFDTSDGHVVVDLGDDLTAVTSSHSFAADVFPDGLCALCAGLELVGSSGVWAVDTDTGAWERVGSYSGGQRRGTFAVADWNADGLLDVVTEMNDHGLFTGAWGGELFAWDPRTGLLLTPIVTSFMYSASIPLVANFDDDPELEVARLEMLDDVLQTYGLVLRDNDLAPIWRTDWTENSPWCTGVLYDFDADGRPDVAQRGISSLAIYSGLDGSVLADATCTSGTATEMVLVADLDGNGMADVLSACESPEELAAWTVLNSPPCRDVRNQVHYYPFVIDDDLTVPCRQQGHAEPGAPPYLNASIQQAPLLRGGVTPAEECRCPALLDVAASATAMSCGSQPVTLDASSTTGCTGGRLYRWLDDEGTVLCDWSPDPTCVVTPSRTTSYLLYVACSEDAGCRGGTRVEIVAAPPDLAASAGPDASLCPGASHLLDGAGSAGSCSREYRWSDETGVVRDWSIDPAFGVTPGRATTFTLDVRCVAAPDCVSSDQVSITLDGPAVGSAVGGSLRASDGTQDSVHLAWCLARPLAPDEHVHVYRGGVASAPLALLAPDPHAPGFVACEWTDASAPDALYFYDVRFSTCTERITQETWRLWP